MGGMKTTILGVVGAVVALALTPTIISAVNDAKTAMGNSFSAAANLLDLVPLVYVAGVLFIAGFMVFKGSRGNKSSV